MKVLKYILLFIFALTLIGLAGKTFLPFEHAEIIMFFGLVVYLIGGLVYIILALINEKHRVEAAMIGISFPLTLGILFSLMRWPFAGPLTVIGGPIILMLSIGLLIYLSTQKRKVSLAALYVATGANSLFFCFKIMFWPGTFQLFIFAAIFIIAATIVLVIEKQKMTSAIIVLIIINGLISITVFANQSRMYCYKHLNTLRPEYNFPEKYYTYAWMLYNEGNIEEAKINLQLAIHEAQNPNNITVHDLDDSPEVTVQRYERALDLVNANNWYEKELSPGRQY